MTYSSISIPNVSRSPSICGFVGNHVSSMSSISLSLCLSLSLSVYLPIYPFTYISLSLADNSPLSSSLRHHFSSLCLSDYLSPTISLYPIHSLHVILLARSPHSLSFYFSSFSSYSLILFLLSFSLCLFLALSNQFTHFPS